MQEELQHILDRKIKKKDFLSEDFFEDDSAGLKISFPLSSDYAQKVLSDFNLDLEEVLNKTKEFILANADEEEKEDFDIKELSSESNYKYRMFLTLTLKQEGNAIYADASLSSRAFKPVSKNLDGASFAEVPLEKVVDYALEELLPNSIRLLK